jgi:hypothetical protein
LKALVIDDRVGTVGIAGSTIEGHMGVARLAVAVDHDLGIVIQVRHWAVADDDVVSYINSDIKVIVVI